MGIYTGVLILQVIIIICLCWGIRNILHQKDNPQGKLMLMVTTCGLVQNIGYLLELLSNNSDQAIIAIRAEYVGGIYLTTFLLMFVASYCEVTIPAAISRMIWLFDAIVLVSIWSYPFVGLYYKELSFDTSGAIPHVVLTAGTIYLFNVLFLIVQLTATIGICIFSMAWGIEERKWKTCKGLLIAMIVSIVGYILGAIDIFKGYDPVPVSVALGIILFHVNIKLEHSFDMSLIAHRDIIRELDQMVVIVDQNYGYIDANDKAKELFPSLRGVTRTTLLPEEELLKLFRDGEGHELTREERTYDVHINEIHNEGGRVGYAMLMVDVTDERRQIEQMRLLKENADKANSAKSDFLARMSHEIRTPINAVLGMDEMILRESGDPSVRKYAQDIKSAAQNLLGIINDILDSSKIESGKMQILPVRYDLGSMLNDIANMTEVRARDKKIKFVMEVSPQLPAALYGDDIRIRQCLNNLLSNAVKYTKEGTVTLRASGRMLNRDHLLLHFDVIDTGIGIKEEELPKLFEAFERIDMNHNRNVEGTGLGMSITAGLLRMMNSELKVQSKYGEGSTFSFELQQKILGTDQIGDFDSLRAKQVAEYDYEVEFVAPDAQVLVVDDNEMNRNVFCNLVKVLMLQVDAAGGGAECLEMISKKHYDLIFLDHMMPEMDGIDTFREMKKMDHLCKDTPVIMLTANAVTGAKEQYMREGFTSFLTKPIVPERLEKAIRTYLPKELIKSTDEIPEGAIPVVQTRQEEDLPEIEGMDWEYAARHVPKNLLRDTLQKFVISLQKEKEKLEELIPDLENKESLDDYRIRVHAMKGTAAMVGAIPLSGLAKVVEKRARAGELEQVRNLHPALMQEMKQYMELLSEFAPRDTKPVKKADMLEAVPLFSMLREALNDREYDTMDALMEDLSKYEMPEQVQDKMELLESHIMNLMVENAIGVVDEIMTIWESMVNK